MPRTLLPADSNPQSLALFIPLSIDHRVENRQQLANCRGQNHLLLFALPQQTLIKRLDPGIESRRHQRRLVQNAAHLRAAAVTGT